MFTALCGETWLKSAKSGCIHGFVRRNAKWGLARNREDDLADVVT